jgi:hypothetical protein
MARRLLARTTNPSLRQTLRDAVHDLEAIERLSLEEPQMTEALAWREAVIRNVARLVDRDGAKEASA